MTPEKAHYRGYPLWMFLREARKKYPSESPIRSLTTKEVFPPRLENNQDVVFQVMHRICLRSGPFSIARFQAIRDKFARRYHARPKSYDKWFGYIKADDAGGFTTACGDSFPLAYDAVRQVRNKKKDLYANPLFEINDVSIMLLETKCFFDPHQYQRR